MLQRENSGPKITSTFKASFTWLEAIAKGIYQIDAPLRIHLRRCARQADAQRAEAVKITTVDLMMDPKGTGLSLERLTRAGDDKIWSARVSRDLRIILRRDGEDNLLAYVGHHNDAYRWAERRKFIPHERSGAMQIVEVIEGQEKAEPEYGDHSSATEPAGEVVQPFWSLTDDQLLDVGVPREWLCHVQEMPEAEIDTLFERLPAEAAEALYDFATGGKLEDHIVTPAEPGPMAGVRRSASGYS
ncbi:hypothetical protein [Qipengyuania flava]|uniref:hypothetical protein n=1 Tax=Qipengyuania flava TaxID=192812 RepID=UPI0012FD5521|nr:hypothetical protein [Qipengyuania flava]